MNLFITALLVLLLSACGGGNDCSTKSEMARDIAKWNAKTASTGVWAADVIHQKWQDGEITEEEKNLYFKIGGKMGGHWSPSYAKKTIQEMCEKGEI